MNWLAHLYLAGPEAADQVGGLLPDLVRASELAAMPAQFHRGIDQHRLIDSFTDAHPAFRRSVRRFEPPFRRYGGILTDVFYDHFLARDWRGFSAEPLDEFIGKFYGALEGFKSELPVEAYERLLQMRAGDWLRSYGELAGVADAVGRIGRRMRRPVELGAAVVLLEREYELFGEDFREFFEGMRGRVVAKREK